MALEKVVAIVSPGVHTFEFGVACEAWGLDRTDDGLPGYDFKVASLTAEPVKTNNAHAIVAPYRLDVVEDADLVVVPAAGYGPFSPEIVAVVRAAHDRGAKVMGLCTGAFVLGEAGLLDGRACTTHWRHTAELSRRFPTAKVDPDVLYVHDSGVYTSAGTAAGIDLCLHVMRTEHGAEVANTVARRMVVPPHRDGGQAQFIEMPISCTSDGLSELMDELVAELAEEHTVESMARRVNMSTRTFARRFQQATGTTPHAWMLRQRVLYARRQLEQTDEPIELIAQRSGFGTAALLRHHFQRHTGVAPTAYRRTFACR